MLSMLALMCGFLLQPAFALTVKVDHFTLKNGLQVVVIPDRRSPIVTHMVWYRVGSADEPQGQAGNAHFLEHLMFKGTHKHPAGEFSRIIRRIGGEENAFTSKDYTAYYQRVTKDRLPLVMELEADRMTNLVLTDEAVAPELQVVLEERNTRTDNDPSSLLSEQLDAASYLVHPYRKPVIGWRPEIAKLNRQTAIDFYRAHYTPKNAIVVVAGDVSADEVRGLAEKYYGPLVNTSDPAPRVRATEPEPIAARRVVLKDPRAATPMIQRSYLTTSYTTAPKGEAEALDILAEALGDGSTSRLYRELVVKEKTASYTGAWYTGDNLDSGIFGVYAAPVPGGDIEPVEKGIDRVLADVAANGITQEELDLARKQLVASTVYALDSQVRLANIFGQALVTGRTVDDVLQWSRRIEAVTVEDVKSAAAKVLKEERSATGILIPAGERKTANN